MCKEENGTYTISTLQDTSKDNGHTPPYHKYNGKRFSTQSTKCDKSVNAPNTFLHHKLQQTQWSTK